MCEQCKSCSQPRANGAVGGLVNFNCADCVARLIRSARPVRLLQNAHIAAMARFHGAEWPAVWAQVQKKLKD